MREFVDSTLYADAQACEENGKRASAEVLKFMGDAKTNINAMRLGPGKHLHGKELFGGVKGEDFDYFQ